MELLFEDKFKTFNATISKYLKKELGKTKGAKGSIAAKDIVNIMIQNKDLITNGLFDAIATVHNISSY